MNTLTIDDFLTHTETRQNPTVYQTDPLVLSVAAQDLSHKTGLLFYSLEDTKVQESITEQHLSRAEEIRSYYCKKYFWNGLKGLPNSDYRNRVCYLLENRIKTCVDKDSGIYYKLPYFYDEDMIYDEFKRLYKTWDIPHGTGPNYEIKTLELLKVSESRQQGKKIVRQWFTDQQYLFCIESTADNPLLPLCTQILSQHPLVRLYTRYTASRIDQMEFYKLYNFTLSKE
jgi:hypothetical protein